MDDLALNYQSDSIRELENLSPIRPCRMDGDALPYQRHGNVGIRSDLESMCGYIGSGHQGRKRVL